MSTPLKRAMDGTGGPLLKNAKLEKPNYFNKPELCSNLNDRIERALEQLKEATLSTCPKHEDVIKAVHVWTTKADMIPNWSEVIKVYHKCSEIIHLESRFHPREESPIKLKMDVLRFPLTKTDVELLSLHSKRFKKIVKDNKRKTIEVEISDLINPLFFKLINDFIQPQPEVRFDEVDLFEFLHTLNKLQMPAFEYVTFYKINELIQKLNFTYLIEVYKKIERLPNKYSSLLMNQFLLGVVFNFEDKKISKIVKDDTNYIQVQVDNSEIIVSEKSELFLVSKDLLYSILEILDAIRNKQQELGLELFGNLHQYIKSCQVGTLLLFHLRCLNKDTDYNSPLECLNELQISYPRNTQIKMMRINYMNDRAKFFYKKGDYNTAMALINNVLSLHSKNSQALYLQAKLFKKIGQKTDAEITALHEDILALDRIWNQPKVVFSYAKLLYSQKKVKEALENCRRDLVAAGYNLSKVYALRGHCYFDLGQYHEALHDYQESMKLSPADDRIKQCLYMTLQKLGRPIPKEYVKAMESIRP